MKNIAFHSNQLGIRGTEVALYDYAYYNETILNNKSFIISDKNKDMQALQKFKDKFNVFLYDKFEDCFSFIRENNIEGVYYQKAGDFDGKIVPGVKNYIHAVFQERQSHGDVYCYISKWLADEMNMKDMYVPYIVYLPNSKKNYREKLNIEQEQIVLGRHGGINEFDIPFVYSVVTEIAKKREDVVFLFMNTRPFCSNYKNIKFIEGTYNLQHKSDYICTCDYMIHARHRGETFGLAVSEFLFHDKPVISWSNGLDKNHIDMLGNKGLWYNNEDDLYHLLLNLKKNNKPSGYYKSIVNDFSPEIVMKRFNDIFLK